jgi:hypothetical protein
MIKAIPSVIPKSIPGCNPMTDIFGGEPGPTFIEQFYNQMVDDVFNERLKQVENRLSQIGYCFEDKTLLKDFLAQNATIITYDDKPHYRELYLFYGQRDHIMIATWWETYQVEPYSNDQEYGYKITVIAGERP